MTHRLGRGSMMFVGIGALLLVGCGGAEVDTETRTGVSMFKTFGVDRAEFERFEVRNMSAKMKRDAGQMHAIGRYRTKDPTQCRIAALLIGHKIANIEGKNGSVQIECLGGLEATLGIGTQRLRLTTRRPGGAETHQTRPRVRP